MLLCQIKTREGIRGDRDKEMQCLERLLALLCSLECREPRIPALSPAAGTDFRPVTEAVHSTLGHSGFLVWQRAASDSSTPSLRTILNTSYLHEFVLVLLKVMISE